MKLLRLLLIVGPLMMLFACATQEPGFYKHSPVRPLLEMPPDLTQPQFDDSYDIPKIGSLLNKKPLLSDGARVSLKRDGRLRWLEITAPADRLWNELHNFWRESEIEVEWENLGLGLMETTWIEYPASDYGQDRFRLRLEPSEKGDVTRIYVSHRGVYSGLFGAGDEPRPGDPELEVEVMGQLLAYLGLEPERRKVLEEEARRLAANKLLLDAKPPAMTMEDSLTRARLLVRQALDRLDYIILDEDREHGWMKIELPETLRDDYFVPGVMMDGLAMESAELQLLKEGEGSRLEVRKADGRSDNVEMARELLKAIHKNL